MKNSVIYLSVCALFVMGGCSKMFQPPTGELVGASYGSKRATFTEAAPLGMVMIPGGSFVMGPLEGDQAEGQGAVAKTITLGGFWMDDTEITNAEYRQFIFWVRDSLLRTKLAELEPEYRIDQDAFGNPVDPPRLNWTRRIDEKRNENVQLIYEEELYVKPSDRIFGKKEYDYSKLSYTYRYFDFRQAAKGTIINAQGQEVRAPNRSAFIREVSVPVYPDTLCWFTDFTYSFNEPLTKAYFWHPSYDQYPVVGVSWVQAEAFCRWRTQYYNQAMEARGILSLSEFTLPLESEWEYAARGGLKNTAYPWGGPYLANAKGCYLANFKPQRGNYSADGWQTTAPVGSFEPNGFGLYDMSGNVAEWTQSAFDESSTVLTHDLNPDYTYDAASNDPASMKRKVVKGGSWKDTKYYLNVGIRTFDYQDSARSFVGFRCVRRAVGPEMK